MFEFLFNATPLNYGKVTVNMASSSLLVYFTIDYIILTCLPVTIPDVPVLCVSVSISVVVGECHVFQTVVLRGGRVRMWKAIGWMRR